MAKVDQLEIINPDGQVYFIDLDPSRGVTNIGRNPENDVVIDSPRVAEFQAILDHRQRPFSLVLLTSEGEVSMDGERLAPNARQAVRSWDTIQMDGVAVVVIEGDAAPAPAVTPEVAAAAEAAEAGAKGKVATKKATRAPEPVYQIMGAPPPDQLDEIVLLELPERAYTVNVTQTAVWRLTVINAGPLVAQFEVAVNGVETPWLQILPPKVNLNEGQRTTVSITVTPPRSPSSRAGPHHFAIVVTSPDYPGRKTQLGATLTINPYYEYGVAELSPRKDSVGWFKRSADFTISIANKGNSAVPYEVVGEDDQKGCSFEFIAPGETVGLAKQTEVTIEPDQVLMLPVRVTPLQRTLVAMRNRNFSLTLTTTPLEGQQQTPRSVLGQLAAAPLIGPLLILILAILLALLIAWIFHPWIATFTADDSRIQAGAITRLHWTASPFTGLRIEPDIGAVAGPNSSMPVTPSLPIRYQLIAENMLSRLIPQWFTDVKDVSVDVVPVLPRIDYFAPDKTSAVTGQSVHVAWSVSNAEDVQLVINGAPETLQPNQFSASRDIPLQNDATFILKASNKYTKAEPVQQNFSVKVSPPTPTPIPTPDIVQFDVNPKEITAGQSVHVSWQVNGVGEVQISGIPGNTTFPNQGSIDTSPAQTTVYVLSAGTGTAKLTRQWQVIVDPAPTATPVPKAPVIEFFTATPNQVVKGSPSAIALSWSVLSGTTNIEISGPTLGSPLANLASQGSISLTADNATLFILTAFNGDLKTSTTANISSIDPSPTPSTTPTPTPPPTPTPVPTPWPAPVIQVFNAFDPGDATLLQQVITSSIPPNQKKYLVKYGYQVTLQWTTLNADTLVLSQGLGSVAGPNGSIKTPPITGQVTYELDISNQGASLPNSGQPKKAYVIVDLLPKPVPPPPYNIAISSYSTSSVTIAWAYDPSHVADIIGFRVYKAPQGSGSFVRVVNESNLNASATSYTDNNQPVCGQQYYVVGVYTDNNGHAQETAVGTPSILTPPCVVYNLQPGLWYAHANQSPANAELGLPVDAPPIGLTHVSRY